jgi:DNA-binding CsgD family transcriptional regulator
MEVGSYEASGARRELSEMTGTRRCGDPTTTIDDAMPLKVLIDAYDALEKAKDSADLLSEIRKFAHHMGFDRFAYALTINAASFKPQQYFLDGFPAGWADRYLSQGYFKVDPLVLHAERTTMPALWDEEMFHPGKAEQFWEEAREFGLHSGVSFSVHDQPGVIGIFSLARDKKVDLHGDELAALIGRAQMFASLLHHAVCRVDLPKLLPQATVTLTERERECLRWAAEGKTAWEIGTILGIAERTAVFHFNNVTTKLGASNKAQAIARAVALKLV